MILQYIENFYSLKMTKARSQIFGLKHLLLRLLKFNIWETLKQNYIIPLKRLTLRMNSQGLNNFNFRCKLFYQKDGVWTERGIGFLHLKKNDEKGQLLVRADTSLGKILNVKCMTYYAFEHFILGLYVIQVIVQSEDFKGQLKNQQRKIMQSPQHRCMVLALRTLFFYQVEGWCL